MNGKILAARLLLVAGVLATGGPLVEHLPAKWHDPVQIASVILMILLGGSPPAHWSTSTPAEKTATPSITAATDEQPLPGVPTGPPA